MVNTDERLFSFLFADSTGGYGVVCVRRQWFEVFFWFWIERTCCRTLELLRYGIRLFFTYWCFNGLFGHNKRCVDKAQVLLLYFVAAVSVRCWKSNVFF